MKNSSLPVARFRAPDGADHTVTVQPMKDGWQVVDQDGKGRQVVDTLTDPRDEREQAEAVARDYAEWATLPTWARQGAARRCDRQCPPGRRSQRSRDCGAGSRGATGAGSPGSSRRSVTA